jgi:hypothetical protein
MSRPMLDFEEVAVDTGVKRRDSGAHDIGRDPMLAFLQSRRSMRWRWWFVHGWESLFVPTDGVGLRGEIAP